MCKAKMCKAKGQARPTQTTQYKNNTQSRNPHNTYQFTNNQNNSGRVRNIYTTPEEKTSRARNTHSAKNESVDSERACYIPETMEDWSTVNFNEKWTETKINKINKSEPGEFWIESHAGDTTLQWLVDTGRPRTIVSQLTANKLISKLGKNINKSTTQVGEFRCFNNNKIITQCIIQINITSGNSASRNCDILVVLHNTVSLLCIDVLQKLVIQLAKKAKR